MKHAKEMFISLGLFAILIVVFLGFTYAFFRAQGGSSTTNDVSVTSNTTDNLSFQISNDITFTVTQADLASGGNNKSGSSTATAVLTPNNKTGAATMNYYMYLNLTENGIIYSSTNTSNQPELMVQVYDSNNQLVSLSGLGSQKTVKGVTGYDITGRLGLIPLLDPQTITASNNTSTTETWQVVVTMINLDVDQNDNTNKTVAGEIIVRKDQQLDSPRIAEIVPQKSADIVKGYVETIIESSFVENDDEIYTIYTVGYIADDTISGTEYSIDIKNLDVDFDKYNLEIVGTPEVMITQDDYTNYVTMKNVGLPLTSLSNGNTNSAEATAQELYTYSLNASELTINDVNINCFSTNCIVTINEAFSNISGKSKHSTTNNNNESIDVLYNGIKFNLKKVLRPDNTLLLTTKYNISSPENITLTDGYIYYHGPSLTYGANDESYRYAGANPNNYVCFGSEASICPAENIYRIIGIIPVDVVITDSPLKTEKQFLYKLIKNDYETNAIGTATNSNASKASSYAGPTGNQPTGDVQGFYWKGSYSGLFSTNTWSTSTLNTTSLNINAYGEFSSVWQKKIAKVMWKVGGRSYNDLVTKNQMSDVYTNEIIYPSTTYSLDNATDYAAKIGLLYMSDYGYAASQNFWSRLEYVNSNRNSNNWLYKGVDECLITRNSSGKGNVFRIGKDGNVQNVETGSGYSNGVRRVFYLSNNVVIDMTNYAGTSSDPYRIL